MFEIFVRFGRHVCFLLPLFANMQLPCLHTNSLHALLLPLMPLVRKNARSGVKSGYSETIAWRNVQLTKQRNVDLTTDGLWAMPLNTGWVPIKACRLQDWEKLKKYVPIHKQGDVCPNGVPALAEEGNNEDNSDSE